jgi:hypothetical protein
VVEDEVAEHVQQHRQDHPVRRVTVEAAQDAADPALPVGDPLDRLVGLRYAGREEDVEVEPARDDDPEQVVADRAEVVERVRLLAERAIEELLGGEERGLAGTVDESEHRLEVCRTPRAATSAAALGAGRKDPAAVGGIRPGRGVENELVVL